MKQAEFIQRYQQEHPEASIEEVLGAWHSYYAKLGGQAKKGKTVKTSVSAFCLEKGIHRNTFYNNKGKYLPLYNNFLKNHTKD